MSFGVRISSSLRPSHWSGRGESLETDAIRLEDRDLKDPRDLDVFLVELAAHFQRCLESPTGAVFSDLHHDFPMV